MPNRFDIAKGKNPKPRAGVTDTYKGQRLTIEITGYDMAHCKVAIDGTPLNPSSLYLYVDGGGLSLEMERVTEITDETIIRSMNVQLVKPEEPFGGGNTTPSWLNLRGI